VREREVGKIKEKETNEEPLPKKQCNTSSGELKNSALYPNVSAHSQSKCPYSGMEPENFVKGGENNSCNVESFVLFEVN
jgi:hypothetical protein